MGVEVVAAILVGLLAVASVAVAYVGILGVAGAFRMGRCEHCGHMTIASRDDPMQSCPYCRHQRLLHPVSGLRHQHGHS